MDNVTDWIDLYCEKDIPETSNSITTTPGKDRMEAVFEKSIEKLFDNLISLESELDEDDQDCDEEQIELRRRCKKIQRRMRNLKEAQELYFSGTIDEYDISPEGKAFDDTIYGDIFFFDDVINDGELFDKFFNGEELCGDNDDNDDEIPDVDDDIDFDDDPDPDVLSL